MMWACSQILSLKGPRMRRIELFVLLALSSLLTGCGGETDEERLLRLVPDARATTPISGTVIVDGAPVKDLWVTLHPKDSSFTFRPRGQTDGKGHFQIMTYSAGDGAPEGDYDITVEWLTYIKRDSDWGGPDKLKNQYNDPSTTPFHVTVEEEPIELPPFELQLEGVEGKPSPSTAQVPRREK